MNRIRSIWTSAVLVAALASAACLSAQSNNDKPLPPPSVETPSLVVFITVDQFWAGYIDRYQSQFTGGLGRLIKGGALFTNAFHDHAVTETAPGHSVVMSGRFPRSTGIVRNEVGVEDPQEPVLGDTSMPGASPYRFRGTAFIDWLRIKDGRSRALSVSRKDRAAILPIGRAHQLAIWYSPTGNFTTSTYYADTLPTWLTQFNARHVPQQYAGKPWQLIAPVSAYSEPDTVWEENGGSDMIFPHPIPSDPRVAAAILANYPYMDEVTAQVALAGFRAMKLGAGPATDLLAVSFSSTDAVGHKYGPDSREIHDQLLRLDRTLGAFLDSIFAVRDSSKVVVALTADHGITPLPEVYAQRTHQTAQRVDLFPIVQQMRPALQARGVPRSAFYFSGGEGMLLVDRRTLARLHVNADSLDAEFVRAAKAVPGVARVDYVKDLARDSATDVVSRRWVHMLPPDAGVDVVVTLAPHDVWGSATSTQAQHGQPTDLDAHVPVLFWGAPFKPGRYTEFARVVDMAPTLAYVTATEPAEALDGHVLVNALRDSYKK